MKETKKNNEDDFLITFSDLVEVVKRNKRKIRFGAIIFALLGLTYGLLKPIQYEAEATFREKGKTSSNVNNFLSASMMMFSDNSKDSEARSMMNSRKLIEELVHHQALQATITKKEHKFPLIPFERIKNNLQIERAIIKNSPFPAIKDQLTDVKAIKVDYDNEIPMSFLLVATSENDFKLVDNEGNSLGSGSFGTSFISPNFSITVIKQTDDNINGNEYHVHIHPLSQMANLMLKQFIIEPDKDDKTLIKISHVFPNRKESAENLNILMQLYQQHIEREHCQICKFQTEYLLTRQKQMGAELEIMMTNYARDLSSDLTTTGFATSEKAMEFLAANQQKLKQQLFVINLEIQRLENAQLDSNFDGELFSTTGNLEVFDKIATERRQLKQHYDSLNLAIRGVQDNSQEFNNTFATQLEELEENKRLLNESTQMLVALNHNEHPKPYKTIIESPKFIVKEWHKRLTAAKDHFDKNASDITAFEEWQQCKDGFSCYLEHLHHFLKVNQRNVEERLANQQSPGNAEYLGINLNTAKDLYIAYTQELCTLESKYAERNFIIDQIDHPDYEISSLSTTLTDPVSVDMITKASNITLSLRDRDNISTKGQERLLADLAIQKGFLKSHLQQSVNLLKLQQDLLRKKIREIQTVNFSLVQEQLSILENQLKEYLALALENLHQEEALLNQNIAELRIEMSAFPQKWTAEQLIEHQMEVNKTLVEEISKLVESKNVSNNMQKFQSAPLDAAIAPIHPKSPRLVLLTIIGAIAGTFLSFAWILAWSVVNGIQAQPDSLRTASMHVSGKVSRQYNDSLDKDPVLDSDLNTLRRLMAFIFSKVPETKESDDGGHTLLLVEGKGPDYSKPLAELMSKKGLKVLIADIRFMDSTEETTPGMLQYLEGNSEQPAIIKHAEFDTLPAGGVCRYANELIGSHRFKELLKSLQKRYDWIIVTSNALPSSAEIDTLLDLFPTAAISIQNESMPQLRSAIYHARRPKATISFVFV